MRNIFVSAPNAVAVRSFSGHTQPGTRHVNGHNALNYQDFLMIRTCFATAVALMFASVANANEIKGKVAKACSGP